MTRFCYFAGDQVLWTRGEELVSLEKLSIYLGGLMFIFIWSDIFYWCKQIKGDSPEMVEYIGMQNLIKALKENLGLKTGKLVFGFEGIMKVYDIFQISSLNGKNWVLYSLHKLFVIFLAGAQ